MYSYKNTLKVSELSSLIGNAFKEQFVHSISVEGEISNFSNSANGHWYFTLKEGGCQINAVMFKNSNAPIKNIPHNGNNVKVTGELTFYKARGQCQIICYYMIPSGEGALLAQLEMIKEKLNAEGLFDASRKKALPILPQKIGLITSRNAAAFEDIKRTFINHNAPVHLFLFHCAVQGVAAATEIVNQIQHANKAYPHLDVLLLSRGGGSVEDLLAFSEEAVVRAVSHSKIPVISGVGHEIDNPLCELTSDIRAHTPTDAAELICKTIQKNLENIQTFKTTIYKTVDYTIKNQKNLIERFSPLPLITYFLRRTNAVRQKIDNTLEKLEHVVRKKHSYVKNHVHSITQILQERSPTQILSRGYALLYDDAKNTIIRSIKELPENKQIHIRLKDGKKSAIIIKEDK